LSDEIAEQFVALDRNASLQVRSEAPSARLAGVNIANDPSALKDGVFRRLLTTTQGYSSGLVLTSSLLGFANFALAFMAPVVAVPVAAVLARKAFVDDRDRRRSARRMELKRRSNRYLDEVGFVVHKDFRDSIKRIHRQLRDHYTERAERLERTLGQARVAAEQARRRTDTEGADAGAASLEHAAVALERVKSAAARLVAVGPQA